MQLKVAKLNMSKTHMLTYELILQNWQVQKQSLIKKVMYLPLNKEIKTFLLFSRNELLERTESGKL